MHFENYEVPWGLDLLLLIYPVGLKHCGSVGFPFLVYHYVLLLGLLLPKLKKTVLGVGRDLMLYLVHFCCSTIPPSS